MKTFVKILLVSAVLLLSISAANAQSKYYDDREGTVASFLDFHLGDGIGRGAKGFGGVNASFLYCLSSDLMFGVGAGVDYYHALGLIGGVKKKKDFDYHGELTSAVFMRGRYLINGSDYRRGAHFFVQCDLGYRFGLSAYNSGKESGLKNLTKNFEKCNVKGLFFEPQFGLAPNRLLSFSLGLPFQRYIKNSSPVATSITEEKDITSKNFMFMGADVHVMINF